MIWFTQLTLCIISRAKLFEVLLALLLSEFVINTYLDFISYIKENIWLGTAIELYFSVLLLFIRLP